MVQTHQLAFLLPGGSGLSLDHWSRQRTAQRRPVQPTNRTEFIRREVICDEETKHRKRVVLNLHLRPPVLQLVVNQLKSRVSFCHDL